MTSELVSTVVEKLAVISGVRAIALGIAGAGDTASGLRYRSGAVLPRGVALLHRSRPEPGGRDKRRPGAGGHGLRSALDEIERFEKRPEGFSLTATKSLSLAGVDALAESVLRLDELLQQVVRLCGGLYSRPDFRS